jgi:hypothetical protein
MSKKDQTRDKPLWVAPKVERMLVSDAEANGTGIGDGGPVGNARS